MNCLGAGKCFQQLMSLLYLFLIENYIIDLKDQGNCFEILATNKISNLNKHGRQRGYSPHKKWSQHSLPQLKL